MNMTPGWFENKRVTIMGLGINGGGLGVALWLLKHGVKLTITDPMDQFFLKPSIEKIERLALKWGYKNKQLTVHRPRYVLGGFQEADFREADMIIRNPKFVREDHFCKIAREAGIPIETDVGIFFQLCPFPITVITGTKGKTSTTMLLGVMAKLADKRAIMAGNLGISVLESLDKLLRMKKGSIPPPVILELSSWQLEGIADLKKSGHVAVITNIMEDHLNRYNGMDDYAAAKALAIKFQTEHDIAILNAGDKRLTAMKQGVVGDAKRIWVGRDCVVKNNQIVYKENKKEIIVANLKNVKVSQNIDNVLAAVAAAKAMGVLNVAIRKGLKTFAGAPGRFELVAKKKGISFINDTTATTADSSLSALRNVGEKISKTILLCGGVDKGLDYQAWAKLAKKTKHLIMFVGTATDKMIFGLGSTTFKFIIVRSMREAMIEAKKLAKSGDIVLLSPGAASFGIFKNEFDRGDQFEAGVKRW